MPIRFWAVTFRLQGTFRNLPYWKSQLSMCKLQLFRSSSLRRVWDLRFTNKNKNIHLTSLFPMNFSTRRILTCINFDRMFVFASKCLANSWNILVIFPRKSQANSKKGIFLPKCLNWQSLICNWEQNNMVMISSLNNMPCSKTLQ